METNFFKPNKTTWETSFKENKPIILIFQEKLCPNCQEYDKNVLSDPIIQKELFSNFLPIFIDINEYPDIYDRFSEGIDHVHTIHSALGTLLGKCADLSNKEFTKNLAQLKELYPKFYDMNLDSYYYNTLGSRITTAPILDDNVAFQEKLDLIAEITLSSLLINYDRIYGGWDINGIKRHPSDALEFLLLFYHRSRDESLYNILIQTLRSSYRGLYDKKGKGFFEITNRNWNNVLWHKKTLNNNFLIIRNLFHTYQVTGDNYYLETLKGAVEFCFDNLWDESTRLFKMGLLLKDDKTYTDSFYPTHHNCNAANILLEIEGVAEKIIGEQDYQAKINDILGVLESNETEFGLAPSPFSNKKTQFLLKDQTAYLNLLLTSYSYSGNSKYLEKSEKILEIILTHYFNRDLELFKDRVSFPNEDFGPMNKNLYPINENAQMVENLINLSYFISNPAYLQLAKQCISNYFTIFGISREAPYPPKFVIANQRLVESPIEILIIGQEDKIISVKRMLHEIKKIYDPFKIIQILDPIEDEYLIKRKIKNFQHFEKPAAFVKIDNTISPPSFFPKEISRVLQTLLHAIKFD